MEGIGPLILGGKVGENTWNSRLAEALRKKGFPSAQFEPLIRVRSGGKVLDRKPDVGMNEGGYHFISGKLGERREFEAYRSADEYKTIFEQMDGLGEVFALTYPLARRERFHLHALPRTGREVELAFTLGSLEEVVDRIGEIIRGRIDEAERFLEPAKDEAPRLLRNAALELADAIRDVQVEDMEAVFGGHDFFRSVIDAALPKARRLETLRLGASFLFVNQSLFYVLLSRSAQKSSKPDMYPQILPRHSSSPEELWKHYFSKVREIDYEPIYGLDVSQFFKGKTAETACSGIIRALLDMSPRLELPDIAGQVFQSLIPLEIRKPLGAHYTNPRAAALLANLAIEKPEARVLDPACGSGTLLVASYSRKMRLSGLKDKSSLHKRFLEKDIFGIDAMAFAGHLAAVNLALQQPLIETDCVQIGTTDSTLVHVGDEIPTTGEALPAEFHQATLTASFGHPRKGSHKRTVVLRRGTARAFRLEPLDVVIMNPPFTSRDNMAPDYRDRLARRYASGKYGGATAGKKISQQVYFMLLADELLKKDGRVAAVLPLTTLGGKDYWPFVDFFTENYTIKFIVVNLGRPAFSEDTSLSECLVVAEKKQPLGSERFTLLGTLKPTNLWDSEDVARITDAARSRRSIEGEVTVKEFAQSDLSPKGPMLPELMLRLIPEYESGRKAFNRLVRSSDLKLSSFKRIREKGIIYRERIEKVRHFQELGASALFAVRKEDRALKAIDRLFLHSEDSRNYVFKDKIGGAEYRFPVSEVTPAIRRLPYLQHLDVTGESDFCVAKPSEALEKTMERLYSKKDAIRMMSRLRRGGMWEKSVKDNSARVVCAGRIDFAGPGTTMTCCRADVPMFLASPNYMADGFDSPLLEKFFVLWMNSTFGIIQLLPAASSTRGTWVRLERFAVDRMLIPDFTNFRPTDLKRIEDLWNDLSRIDLASLVDQLKMHHPFRVRLDDGLALLLGVKDKAERDQLTSDIRRGALAAIEALRRSMTGESKEND